MKAIALDHYNLIMENGQLNEQKTLDKIEELLQFRFYTLAYMIAWELDQLRTNCDPNQLEGSCFENVSFFVFDFTQECKLNMYINIISKHITPDKGEKLREYFTKYGFRKQVRHDKRKCY